MVLVEPLILTLLIWIWRNVSKYNYCYSDHQFPAESATYPEHTEMFNYIKSYAEKHDLYDNILFNMSLISIEGMSLRPRINSTQRLIFLKMVPSSIKVKDKTRRCCALPSPPFIILTVTPEVSAIEAVLILSTPKELNGPFSFCTTKTIRKFFLGNRIFDLPPAWLKCWPGFENASRKIDYYAHRKATIKLILQSTKKMTGQFSKTWEVTTNCGS